MRYFEKKSIVIPTPDVMAIAVNPQKIAGHVRKKILSNYVSKGEEYFSTKPFKAQHKLLKYLTTNKDMKYLSKPEAVKRLRKIQVKKVIDTVIKTWKSL